jgi:hypothetical protein
LANSASLIKRAVSGGAGSSEAHLLVWMPKSMESRRRMLRSLLAMDVAMMESSQWYPATGVVCGSGLLDSILTTCLGDYQSRVMV